MLVIQYNTSMMLFETELHSSHDFFFQRTKQHITCREGYTARDYTPCIEANLTHDGTSMTEDCCMQSLIDCKSIVGTALCIVRDP